MQSVHFKNEAALLEYAAKVALFIESPLVIFLSGNLGVGKTTFVRGLLHALGFEGAVKSPTFTLVEDYFLPNKLIYHFDLYRINDPEELEWMGIRDYLDHAILLVEWPERAIEYLPSPDLSWRLDIASEGRDLVLLGATKRGKAVLEKVGDNLGEKRSRA